MKTCPRCNQTYTDEQLNFCLNDGELLMQTVGASRPFDDSPPTVMMNDARVTNPTNWQAPIVPWQNPQTGFQPGPTPSYQTAPSPNQTLAIVSLGLGVASITIGWCCSLGLILSPAALITGFIALSQIKKDPQRNGGRGLAIGGMVTGAFYILAWLAIMLLYGAAIFFGSLGK